MPKGTRVAIFIIPCRENFRSSAHNTDTDNSRIYRIRVITVTKSCVAIYLLLLFVYMKIIHYLDFQFLQKNGWGQITLSTRTRVTKGCMNIDVLGVRGVYVYFIQHINNIQDVQKTNTILKSDILIPLTESWECKS